MNFFRNKVEAALKWLALHPVITQLSVTKKIVFTYGLVTLFSLVAITYAMLSLHEQMTISTRLVHGDAKSVALARDLQSNLASQERLEKQFLLLQKDEIRDLMFEKYAAFPRIWSVFLPLLEADMRKELSDLYRSYRRAGDEFEEILLSDAPISTAEKQFNERLLPAHLDLYQRLDSFKINQQQKIDSGLEELARDSERSFQVTFLLLLVGFLLGSPVALSVIFGIHYSLRLLTNATQQVAEGNYDVDIDIAARDEFGQLATEFKQMSRKLREFEELNLDANPLTHLPGNLVIQRRVEELLRDDIPFAHAFVDLDHFKAYNDRYGYQNGSDIISDVGQIIEQVVAEDGNTDDFIGHIGGDDYIFLTTPDKVENLSERIIDEFEQMIPEKYSDEDREAGFFVCQDRFGVERQFPLMTISIAIICSQTSNYDSAIAISHECAKMKEHLKRLPGSNYLVDRRKGRP